LTSQACFHARVAWSLATTNNKCQSKLLVDRRIHLPAEAPQFSSLGYHCLTIYFQELHWGLALAGGTTNIVFQLAFPANCSNSF